MEELQKQLDPLREVKSSLLCAVDEILTTKSEVEAQVEAVTAQIQSSFEELQQVLAHRKYQLIKEAAVKGAEKLEHLSEQEKKLTTSCAAVQSMIEYTEQCIGHSTDDEVLCEVRGRIEREVAEQKCSILYPVEEADIGVEVSCAEDLKQLCLTKAKLTKPVKVTVTGEGIKSAKVNKMSEFLVTAKLGDGKQMKRRIRLECHLKSLASGSTTKCDVSNEYRIQYTPTVRGRHEILVAASGLEIAGSPFPVFVSSHPTQLVEPVRIISGIEPLHVAINSAGEMVLVEPLNAVIFDRERKRVTSIKLKEEHGINPFGLAIDSDDIIYIPGRQNGSFIIKLTPKLKLVNRSRKFDAEFWNLSIFKDHLLVCNGKDNGIMVFNKELELVRDIDVHKIASGGLKNIRSVSLDHRGNMYVCGGDSPVHVFTTSGQLLRSFPGEKSVGTRGICVAGGYVYVTDYATHDILAYTTEGEHVSTFKQHSNCDFNRPWGMCADKDGFLYICDRENKRVVVF